MHIRSTSDGKVLRVHFTEARILDELVIRQVQDELLRVLKATQEPTVVLDFRFVKSLSSSALGMLVRVHRRCKHLRTALKLCNIGEEIQKVFKIAGLDEVLRNPPTDPRGPPHRSGVVAKLKPRARRGMTARNPDPEEE